MKNKIISILAITMIMLVLMIGNVHAADEKFTVKLDASTETVLPGGTVILHVTIPTIEVEKGIGTLTGTIEYDKTVFEVMGTKDVKNKEDWESVTFNANNGAFVTLTLSGETIKESTEVFDITLKVLDTAKAGDTTVKLTKLSSSDGDKDIDTDDATKTIKIKGSSSDDGGYTAIYNLSPSPTAKVNNTIKGNNTNKNGVSVLPYAGESDMVLLGMGALVIGIVIGYFKLKALKEI